MAAAFVGISASSATRLFGPRMTARRIASLSSFIFVVLALAVAAFALSLVVSGGVILSDWSILAPAVCVAVTAALSWRFPRAFGFPALVALGAAVAIMGYCLFSLPPAAEAAPVGSVALAQGGSVSVRFAGIDAAPRRIEVASLFPVHAEVLVVRFHRFWPVLGGTARSSLRSVRFGSGAALFSPHPSPLDRLFPTEGRDDASRDLFWGISIEKISSDFSAETAPASQRLRVYLQEGSIRFVP